VSRLGAVGVWAAHLRSRDPGRIRDVATTIEDLGYEVAWVPGGSGGDLLAHVDTALGATGRITVATGILNIWAHDAGEVAAWHAGVRGRHPDRMLLGLGAGHAEHVENYRRPLSAMRSYLDALDAAPDAVPADERLLAALGPRMLALAAERACGAHPYLVDPGHTLTARAALGPGPLLAPELKVVLDDDPARARAVARAHLASYLELPNYTSNLRRVGYTDDDLADGGSDRLVDGVVAHGDVAAIVRRAREHVDAGADHICIQVLTADRREVPAEAWRALAPALRAELGAQPRPAR
jgi:probable F420-dependent oxidoreductase